MEILEWRSIANHPSGWRMVEVDSSWYRPFQNTRDALTVSHYYPAFVTSIHLTHLDSFLLQLLYKFIYLYTTLFHYQYKMVRMSVLADALKTIYNAEKRGKRQVVLRPSSKVIVKFLQAMQVHGTFSLLFVTCLFLGRSRLRVTWSFQEGCFFVSCWSFATIRVETLCRKRHIPPFGLLSCLYPIHVTKA